MITALGMMSGTSLDGVDAALITTDGIRIEEFGRSGFRAYGDNESGLLHSLLGKWQGEDGVSEGAALSEAAHAQLAADFPEAQLLGYHGQTFAHDPGGRGTHQAGSGARLAQVTGRPVVWDFRTEDVRRGGEGAPLVPFFHWACADWAVGQGRLERGPVAFLNLGGVGNISWVDTRLAAPEAEGACLAFDTGPANAPINDLIRTRLHRSRDEGGALAASGSVDEGIVARFLADPFFDRAPPKSLDRDRFADLSRAVRGLGDADAAATLVAAVAGSVGAAMRWLPRMPAAILVCGGGRHNRAIMRALGDALPLAVRPVEDAGLDGDMLEAQAFGWLAVRVMRGLPISGPMTTGVPEPVCGGRISHPRNRGTIRAEGG
ncbi:anhydro-N-acetylmuramic acid kinase [Paracoccus sp. 1_MG-2023]|uniref:anhydro-N-acetylmuramic acid kinase n=1 Tax=unclassified Paracoccus (in: a-proteobacteria) TaxID=2688777 RepID=UPI001C09FB22|nr:MULTISPECIES: anhydro-N-acetylmuramic acid kinase [unclassified Paracoccus (in: a-proteobacteria)]MBU2958901.1 anhydro-N-acetylmuramic acid kinase [Paracoccus sp. C2R09]MDO6670425.1 anhydro-N-acetylmuramic acid kinase [Paracoccus sp. 1_MG-2023]